MKNFVMFLGLMLLTTNLTFANAGKKDSRHQFGEKMRKELGLSDEQLVKMKEIRKERKGQMKEKREKVKEAKLAFKEIMKDPKASRESIEAKYKALSEAKQASKDLRFETMMEVRGLLKADQLTKFLAMKDKKHGHRKGKSRQ